MRSELLVWKPPCHSSGPSSFLLAVQLVLGKQLAAECVDLESGVSRVR